MTQFALLGAGGGEWNPGAEQNIVNAVRAFWNSLAANLPDELRITVSPVIDQYNRETGDLIGSYTAGAAPTVVAGTNVGVYAGGAGAKIVWNTGSIRDGRRVRGSTYLVPISSGVFTNTGTVNTTFIGQVNTAAGTLISTLAATGAPLGVWSRPRPATDTKPFRVGMAFDVESGACNTKSAILRGRRD